ncbi:MAG: glucuronate isomerase [Clostridiaceae bacterium]|nr:glucuronate isomerase [Clostridiaceae bacterium]
MKEFMDVDFLLKTKTARELYENFAKNVAIVDYHCHIDPREIAENVQYENLAQMWLKGDHYKWRIMRANGVDEYYITGDASDEEKFQKYAESLANSPGNPLYHWSHMELSHYFDYHGVLNGSTARDVWEHCNSLIRERKLDARSIIAASNVELICTTDDPVDDLKYHEMMIKDTTMPARVLPAWRPDKLLKIESPHFNEYIDKLAKVSGADIDDYDSFIDAIAKRMDYFHQRGCKLSDHGINQVDYLPASLEQVADIFARRRSGQTLSREEVLQYQTSLLLHLGREYNKKNWVMQLHLGAGRDINTQMYNSLGPDSGFDCIGHAVDYVDLSRFLNALYLKDELPKTVVYSLNPNDNAVICTILGCFQGGSVKGKMQHGSAWWFNDHIRGMRDQMTTLANYGVLGNFIGMTTDSRSILSYVRHDYFRRILCDILGSWVENGEYPDDQEALGEMVRNISHDNSMKYFDF